MNYYVMQSCQYSSFQKTTCALYADYLDLDGLILIKDDPYSKIKVEKGLLSLSEAK